MLSLQQQKTLAAADCHVAFDNLTRQLYATDASVYQIEPGAVAFPRNAAQANSVIRAAAQAGLPVTARGAGTGLAGGALGDGLIVDFSRHNRQITGLDLEKRTVRVGAGVVLDQLNDFLRPHEFCFGPDVATSSRATLGGMIANDSSGARVPVYGTTSDHVVSLEVILADGRIETVTPQGDALRAEREFISGLARKHAAQIAEHMPPGFPKRWPGYGIDRFMRHADNLNYIFSGSEGTLAAIVSAELKIVPPQRRKAVGLVFFASLGEAMRAAAELLDLQPAAVEHADAMLLNQTRGQATFRAARDLLELDARPCESVLIVEFFDDVDDRLAALAAKGLGVRTKMLRSAQEMDLVWTLRKTGLSLLTSCPGRAKPLEGIADAAVQPQHLAGYVAGLREIFRRTGLNASFYGHAASGLLHVRPVVDLHRQEDVAKYRQVANEVAALVRQFKGSLAAEHGLGMARTEFLPGQIGPELFGVMREIKTAFDPKNLFNPGKVIGNGRFGIDRNLRSAYSHDLKLPGEPMLAFAGRDKSFVANLEQCNGCAACRKDAPTMCPTFIATGEEIMSTRGRANAIRAALELRGLEGGDPLRSAELEAALSNCLSCKACTTECPSNVNMALLKAELLHARIRRDGLPLRARLVSSVDTLGKLGCLAPGLANAALEWPWLRRLMAKTIGFSAQRRLPCYTAERFDLWFVRRGKAGRGTRGKVILWDDTFVRYHEPHIGIAAVKVLEAAGFEVVLPAGRKCCGRPAFSQGNLAETKRLGQHNLALLTSKQKGTSAPPHVGAYSGEDETPILFLEPSCWSMFVEDYRELGLPGADRVSKRCFLFERFIEDLLSREPGALHFNRKAASVAIHAHCHAKSLLNPAFMAELAQRLPERKVTLLNTGCCGMAGAFGALESKYDLSVKVAGPLVEQIRQQPSDAVIVASGTSCRQQISHLTATRPRHMAELLAEALADD